MADVAHLRIRVLEAEIAADRAGGGDHGIGGAEQVADAGDDVIAFERERDDRGLLHEAADGGEKRLVGDV